LRYLAKRVIISVTNDLKGDQRVHRVAMSLMELGYEVTLLGRLRKSSDRNLERPYKTHRMRLPFERGKLFYLSYAVWAFWWLLFRKADIFLANDLDTLLPNFLVAKLRGKKLVYDSHEYWTEIPELLERPGTRRIWLWLEKRLFPRVDAAYTVSASIAQRYSETYGLEVKTVRNLPQRSKEEQMPWEQRGKQLIYQGALNIGRGIEAMIAAMEHLEGYQLWIAGTGTEDVRLQELAQRAAFPERIKFLGQLAPAELRKFTAQAKLGMSLEEDLGQSYRFALPNKLFDYIQSHTPVLVSDLPEMAKIVSKHGVGKVLPNDHREARQIADEILSICEDAQLGKKCSDQCALAAAELNWEKESEVLKEIFRSL
jgi:glycosyltransferase involved in cell wall biosynthesis